MLLQVMRPLAKEIKAILAAENDHMPSASQTLTERILTVPRLPNIEHERPCLVTDKGNNTLTMCPLATIGGLSLGAFDDLTKFFSAPIGERACSETELRGRPQLQSRPAWEHKDGRACYVIGVRFRMSVAHVRVPHSRPVVDQELNAFKIWIESRRHTLMSLSPDARRLLVKSFKSKTPARSIRDIAWYADTTCPSRKMLPALFPPAVADPQAPMPTDSLHAFKLDPRCSIFVPSHATRRKFGLITNHDIEQASLSSGVGEEETAAPDAAGPQARRLAVVQKRDAMIYDAKENEMPGASPSVSPI
ncbi:hypothetical protein EXIGLDRAFT_784324 [Exidia glandulosa HHB12029]|uniref:Uncharacterized protein n=1 Tax=Exidia glandulosa HHB12029 TaxID=1314781 RepID=A0A166MIX1_EXIGL|nr:hypothetical protein EXIGLDRAFT_784324 [Exidia glandulosa HHB12029]